MLSGSVNTHNTSYWSEGNPHVLIERNGKQPGVTVFVAIAYDRIIGPFVFTKRPAGVNQGPVLEPCTVNAERYLDMLQNFFLPEWQRLPQPHTWRFQQDGAPPHYSLQVRDFLDRNFGDRWIGRGVQETNLSWPARSPDLTPLDYFLWGHIKEIVYKRKPGNLYELVQFIYDAFDELKQNPTMLHRAFDNLIPRYTNCVREHGRQQL